MAIKKTTETTAAAPAKRVAPVKRIKAAAAKAAEESDAKAAEDAELPLEEDAEQEEAAPSEESAKKTVAPPKRSGGIKLTTEAAAQEDEEDDDGSWLLDDDAARARSEVEAQKRAEEEEERKSKAYWPMRFSLRPPSAEHTDSYQADIIILDAKIGPRYYEHMMANNHNGWRDVPEPCPKERDNCPICPPNGDRESVYVMLLTVLNLNGYTRKKGPLAGTHIPITKDLLATYATDHAFFYDLLEKHGTLRGIQLKMVRKYSTQARYGIPEFVGIHTDEDIEEYIKAKDMWRPDTTLEGEVKDPDPSHLMHAFKYTEFLKKPSALKLAAKYAGNPGAHPGQGGTSDSGQWGGGRYDPATQGGRGQLPPFDGGLSDDVPF